MASMRNIVVVRALGGVGDVLCAVPALTLLRRAAPDARVSYIGLPQAESLIARYLRLVDRFMPFPGFPGIVEHPHDPRALDAFLDTVRNSARFDLAIQMHGSGSVSNVFAALLGAERMAGYHLPGLWRPGPDFAPFPDALDEVTRWTALIDRLFETGASAPLAFPLAEEERWSLEALEGRRYAVVHAGSSDPSRRWPAARFAAVADRLLGMGLSVVLTGVRGEEEVVGAVRSAMAGHALDLCGQTTLSEAAALIDGAALVVTNDTGTSHLAAALGTPSVVLFIASDRARWAPAAPRRHRAVGEGVPDAVIGGAPVVIAPSHPSVEDVEEAVADLLEMAA